MTYIGAQISNKIGMNLLWLMAVVSLLAAANVVAQDKTNQDDEQLVLNLVRAKACAGRSCGDANEMAMKSLVMKLQQAKAGENNKNKTKSENPAYRRCRTLRCRLRFGTNKDGNQEGNEAKDGQGADDAAEKRCMSWNCKKRRFQSTREKKASKNRKVGAKRCMAWDCRKRSHKTFMRHTPIKRKNGAMKQEGKVQRDVRQAKRCTTDAQMLRCKNRKQNDPTPNVRRGCLSWRCKNGKRSVAKRGSEAIETSKINSRGGNDLLDLSRSVKCRGLQCLTKRTRNLNLPDAIISHNELKKEIYPGCLARKCYGKRNRMVAKKADSAATDISKKIINRKKYKDLDIPSLSSEKCRGWDCLEKRLVHNAQGDKPTNCVSWDCYKRKADIGKITLKKQKSRSTRTQGFSSEIQEGDSPQYGLTTDEYKDTIRRAPTHFTEEDLQNLR